jgi:hypothetical protein
MHNQQEKSNSMQSVPPEKVPASWDVEKWIKVIKILQIEMRKILTVFI